MTSYFRACGCEFEVSLTEHGWDKEEFIFCSKHNAAEDMYKMLKVSAEYYEMLEAATGVEHPVLAEIRATIDLADGK